MNIIEKQQIKYYHSTRLKEKEKSTTYFQGWTTQEVQQKRFEVNAELLDFSGKSLLDVVAEPGISRDFWITISPPSTISALTSSGSLFSPEPGATQRTAPNFSRRTSPPPLCRRWIWWLPRDHSPIAVQILRFT